MGHLTEPLGVTKRKLGVCSQYGTLELTDELIENLYEATPPRYSVSIQPNKDGGGVENGIDLLTAVHRPASTGAPLVGSEAAPAHAFEMRNINGRIGFQFVMGTERGQKQMRRQLENFYPDAHVMVSEHPHPGLIPLEAGYHVAAAILRLRKRADGDYLYPIRHMDIEGFENDPYGSITSEMIGERESDYRSDIAVQTIFRPAPSNWWQGSLLSHSIDDVADELKNPTKEFGWWDSLEYLIKQDKGLEGREREASAKDRTASKIVREQRGEKGFRLNLRIIAVSDAPDEAVERVEDTAQMFDGYYESTTEQGFEIVPQWGSDLEATVRRAFARTWVPQKMVMGVRAAAGLMHIPNEDINTQDVDWSVTSHAGDVPADATRFSDWQDRSVVDWTAAQRSHTMHADDWHYDIGSEWTGESTADEELEVEA